MLRIKQVGSYSIARYPEAEFRPWRQPAAVTLIRSTTVSTALLLILQSCDGTGTTGPPPVPPELITENEARAVITGIFSDNGISLASDVPLSLVASQDDTTRVVLDGYNESLRVGYEYLSEDDNLTFTQELTTSIEANNAGSGPYIKVTYPESNADYLEYLTQAFIDTLKAQGKI